MDFDEIRRRLSRLDTACVCDGYKALDKPVRAVDPAIRPVSPGLRLIGRAHTLTCREDFLTVIVALRDALPGEVLVIDSQGSRKALTGELFPTEARRKGLAGIVNDGPCRDTAAIRQQQLPYYARSVNPVAGTTDRLFETQVPVTCGGVRVHPGEIVFGDDDGLIVASSEEISEIIPVAEEVQRKEARLLAEMERGRSLIDMLNLEDHCAKIRAGQASRLQFLV
ncbi:MAG: RraA family protein [Gemmatimonadota bacterium]|nr:RraA family protein [Gemmatimonadota bacterium]